MEFRLENSPAASSLSVDITLRFSGHQGEIPFQSALTDLNEIRVAIDEAQQRILQPSLLKIDGLGTQGDRPRGFSENCVCVHAKGSNMPDLYFYDIPGKFRLMLRYVVTYVHDLHIQGVIRDVPDGEDQDQIALIEGLVKTYVEKPDCIVLLVLTCESEDS